MWPILVAPNRRRDKQVLFLIVSFFGNHQGFVQSSGSVATRQSWEAAGSHEEAAGNRGGTKGSFWGRVHCQDTAGGRQKANQKYHE